MKIYTKKETMKKIILIVILAILGCSKEPKFGYIIHNYSGSVLFVTTPEGVQRVDMNNSFEFISSENNCHNFTYRFENELLKPLISDLHTNPVKHINVTSYLFDLCVTVTGLSDSVEITINGEYFKEKVPFEWGINDHSVKNYNIISNPDSKEGHVYTIIYVDGKAIRIFEHYYQVGYLNGNINYQ